MTKALYFSKYKSFCELLIKVRKDAGFSQAKLAKKLKKHQSFISKIEQGERTLNIIETIEILKILKVDIHLFINNLEEATKQKNKKKRKEPQIPNSIEE